jgi:hypothetical protein
MHSTNMANAQKIFAIAMGATANIFAKRRATPKVISTYIRMNYLSQPITGLLLKPVNFFQDGSIFNKAFVRAGRSMNILPSQILFRCQQC